MRGAAHCSRDRPRFVPVTHGTTAAQKEFGALAIDKGTLVKLGPQVEKRLQALQTLHVRVLHARACGDVGGALLLSAGRLLLLVPVRPCCWLVGG
jgi:hypothetical protein